MITNYNYLCTLIPAIKRERGNFLKIPCGSQLSPILKTNRNPVITINLLLTEVICYPFRLSNLGQWARNPVSDI